MDRNLYFLLSGHLGSVALRKESVDRNLDYCDDEHTEWVALRKESVDRNLCSSFPRSPLLLSLSARRAWIEIFALRYFEICQSSLSARRAWIEIAAVRRAVWSYYVALRKESVDRNWVLLTLMPIR